MSKPSTGLGRELPPLPPVTRLPVAGAGRFRVKRGRIVLVTTGTEPGGPGRGAAGAGEGRKQADGSLISGSPYQSRTEFHSTISGPIRATGCTQTGPQGAENAQVGPLSQVLLPNDRERQFVEEYLRSGDATKARKVAGFAKGVSPYLILDRPCVQQLIRDAALQAKDKLNRTAEDTLRDIQDIIQDTKQEKEYRIALKALELEGKILGIFSETLKIEKKESHEDRLRRAVAQLDQRSLLPPVPGAPAQLDDPPGARGGLPGARGGLPGARGDRASILSAAYAMTDEDLPAVAQWQNRADGRVSGPHSQSAAVSGGAPAAGDSAPGAHRKRVVFPAPRPVIDITPSDGEEF